MDKPSYLLRYLASFVLATVIFVFVFTIAYSVSYFNYQRVSSDSFTIEQYLNQVGSSEICSSDILLNTSILLDQVGSRLSLLEDRFGKTDRRVLQQKSFYTELEERHYQLIEALNSRCDKPYTTVLFFYSNSPNFEDQSNRVGFVLSTLKRLHPEFMIYSFDVDLDSEIISNLTGEFNVTDVPIVIVNENDRIFVSNIDQFDKYISNY